MAVTSWKGGGGSSTVGTPGWSSLPNVLVDNLASTYSTIPGYETSGYLIVSDFGFTDTDIPPGSIITDVWIRATWGPVGSKLLAGPIGLSKVVSGTAPGVTDSNTGYNYIAAQDTFGGAFSPNGTGIYSWNTSPYTEAEIKDGGFSAWLSLQNYDYYTSAIARAYYVEVQVGYTPPGDPPIYLIPKTSWVAVTGQKLVPPVVVAVKTAHIALECNKAVPKEVISQPIKLSKIGLLGGRGSRGAYLIPQTSGVGVAASPFFVRYYPEVVGVRRGLDITEDLINDIGLETTGRETTQTSWAYNVAGQPVTCVSGGINAAGVNGAGINACVVAAPPATVGQYSAEQTYVIGSQVGYLIQTYQRVMDMTQLYGELNQAYSIRRLEFHITQTYSVDSSGPNLRQFDVHLEYSLFGRSFLDEFLVLLNEERAKYSLAPIEGLWIDRTRQSGPDIAHGHSKNMAANFLWAHSSTSFPLGWQTPHERQQLLYGVEGVSRMSEALLTTPLSPAMVANGVDAQSPIDSRYHQLTPSELLWKFLNEETAEGAGLLAYFAEQEHPLLAVGNVAAPYPGQEGRYQYEFTTVLILGYGAPGDTEMANLELNQTYTLTPAMIETLDQAYTLEALSKARGWHETRYSIKVAYAHTTVGGVQVTASHEAGIMYSTTGTHEAEYGDRVRVLAQHSALFNLEEYLFVAAQHEAPFAVTVASAHEVGYSSYTVSVGTHEAGYDSYSAVYQNHEAAYGSLITVRRGHEAGYALMGRAVRQHEATYTDTVGVIADHHSHWDLLAYNVAQATHTAYWALVDERAITTTASVRVVLEGAVIDALETVIASSEPDALWQCKLALKSMDDYVRFTEGTTFTVSLLSDTYHFQYNSKELVRSSPAGVGMRVEGLSPAMVLTEPRADRVTVDYEVATSAQTIIEDIVGGSVVWDFPTWAIPAYRVAAVDAVPLPLAKSIAASVGAVLESTIGGQLRFRRLYEVDVPDYATSTPHQVYTDTLDNLSSQESFEHRAGYNRFRVMDADPNFADRLEFVADDVGGNVGVLRVYPSPWRESILVKTTYDPLLVYVGNKHWTTREETEVVEFQAGQARLSYPAQALQSVVWRSGNLGSVMHTEYSDLVSTGTTTTNYGYGVAEITYITRYLEYDTSVPVGDEVQYVVEDIS